MRNTFDALLQAIGLRERPSVLHPPPEGDALIESAPRHGALFLDFDGVLHSGNSGTFALLPGLEQVLREYPYVDIVISSEWRNAGIEYLRRLFSRDIAPRVLGITPDYRGSGSRESEIRHIVSRYGIRHWVALDDNLKLFPGRPSNLVVTEFGTGLTPTHLQELRTRFASWQSAQ